MKGHVQPCSTFSEPCTLAWPRLGVPVGAMILTVCFKHISCLLLRLRNQTFQITARFPNNVVLLIRFPSRSIEGSPVCCFHLCWINHGVFILWVIFLLKGSLKWNQWTKESSHFYGFGYMLHNHLQESWTGSLLLASNLTATSPILGNVLFLMFAQSLGVKALL